MRLEGVLGLYHFLFLIIVAILGSVTIYIFCTKLKNERSQSTALKILSGIWFICGMVHQITLVYEDVVLKSLPNHTWAMLIPFTYCSVASFITPLVIIFFKKDNRALHFLTYYCFFGGFSIFVAPWLDKIETFFVASSIFALIHHAFMFVMGILLVIIKYIRPTMKRIYVCPIGMGAVLLLGVIEKYALKFPNWVGEPLLKNSPILTSWWMVSLVGFLLIFIIVFFFEILKYKKTTRQIFNKQYLLSDFIKVKKKL